MRIVCGRAGCAVLALLLLPLAARAQTAVFVGTSTAEPVGAADDAVITMAGGSNPAYGSLAVTGALTWTWPNAVTCWYSGNSFTATVTLTDSLPHQVMLYAIDDDKQSRAETISLLGNTQTVSAFTAGVYYTWTLTGPGSFPFIITRTAGVNAVLTSVAFYTPAPAQPGASPAPPQNVTVMPPYAITVAWQESDATAVSFNIYRNAAKYASAAASPFKDTAVLPGQTYYYAVTAVNSAGQESTKTPVTGIQVPASP